MSVEPYNCGFCGALTNARHRFCCDSGREFDKAAYRVPSPPSRRAESLPATRKTGVPATPPREPTEAMVAAGHRAWRAFIESWGDEPVNGTSASDVWRAMYDAAMNHDATRGQAAATPSGETVEGAESDAKQDAYRRMIELGEAPPQRAGTREEVAEALALVKSAESDAKDAARYRWLRDCPVDGSTYDDIVFHTASEDWDRAIDTAIAKEKL